MPSQTLPNDFGSATEALVVDYRIQTPCRHSRIQLAQNVFSFLLEGTKELITPDRAVLIDSQHFLLIGTGNCLMSERLSSSRAYHSVLFFFPDALVERLQQQYALPTPAEAGPSAAAEGFAMLPYDAYLRHFVQGLLVLLREPTAAQQRLLPAKLAELLLYLVERDGPGVLRHLKPGRTAAGPQQRLRQVVEANALNHLSVAELAFLCSMSVSTFKRHFEHVYHTSPSRWFQHRRLQHSAYLLTARQQRPSDIYSAAGFETLSSFTQAFKQQFGLTPKQFQLAE